MTERQELIATLAFGILKRACPLHANEINATLVMVLGHEPAAIDSPRLRQCGKCQPSSILSALPQHGGDE